MRDKIKELLYGAYQEPTSDETVELMEELFKLEINRAMAEWLKKNPVNIVEDTLRKYETTYGFDIFFDAGLVCVKAYLKSKCEYEDAVFDVREVSLLKCFEKLNKLLLEPVKYIEARILLEKRGYRVEQPPSSPVIGGK